MIYDPFVGQSYLPHISRLLSRFLGRHWQYALCEPRNSEPAANETYSDMFRRPPTSVHSSSDRTSMGGRCVVKVGPRPLPSFVDRYEFKSKGSINQTLLPWESAARHNNMALRHASATCSPSTSPRTHCDAAASSMRSSQILPVCAFSSPIEPDLTHCSSHV
jgi:hypothetical protein